MGKWILAISIALITSVARAETVEASAAGFTIRHQVLIGKLKPEQVWPLLVEQVGHWWDKGHTYSGDARNMQIEAAPAGCFCEHYAAGSVVHATVINVQAHRQLRLSGALGPLQETASTGILTWTLTPVEQGTQVTLDYVVGGYRPGGLAEWASPVDGVLGIQMQRFQRFAQTGNAEPVAP
ncbi:MAG: ATPase [Panacagrimonas sp.]